MDEGIYIASITNMYLGIHVGRMMGADTGGGVCIGCIIGMAVYPVLWA
jgi:hypothetical protein